MIRQRGDKWHFEFMAAGRRMYGVCEGCTTKRTAEAYEKRMRDTVSKATEQKNVRALIENFRDELTGGETVTLAAAFDRYLTKPAKRQPGEHQLARNRTYWTDFVSFMAANYPETTDLAAVTRRHAEEYVSTLRTGGAFDKTVTFIRDGKQSTYTAADDHLSPRTINARQQAIRAVFARLKEDAGLLANPFDVPKLKLDTESRDVFSESEIQQISDNWTMPYIKPVFLVGFNTGLTLGDICLLKWDEIAGNWITNKRRRKTGTALEIPILPPLAAFLAEQRTLADGGEYVFPELAEMYLTNPTGVNYRIRAFLKSIGIDTAEQIEGRSRAVSVKAAHAMRHTFAYQAGKHNIPLPIVQAVLGHLSPAMTALYEQHAKRADKARFFQNMETGLAVPETVARLPEDAETAAREKLKRMAETLPTAALMRLLKIAEEAEAKNFPRIAYITEAQNEN